MKRKRPLIVLLLLVMASAGVAQFGRRSRYSDGPIYYLKAGPMPPPPASGMP